MSGDPLTSGSHPQGLERFRQVLQDLQELLEQATRSERYKPSEDLSLARVRIGDAPAAIDAIGEILDLSADGIKIALGASHPVEVDQRCRLNVGATGSPTYALLGRVRWVERNPYITVFGLSLEDVSTSGLL